MSSTDWSAVLNLPIHYLSLDASLSLQSLLQRGDELRGFIERGGRLALGVVPTGRPGILRSLDVRSLFESHLAEFAQAFPDGARQAI